MNVRDFKEQARKEVVAFAKSEQEKPSVKMVDAVNAHFRSIFPNEGQKSAENAVAWRQIEAQRLVIDLIRDLSSAQLEKSERALKTIAGTFATVRCVGGDWKAYVALEGRTSERVIDEQTAKDFKLGKISMGDIIEKLFPYGLPERETSLSNRKRWRR